MRRPSHTTICVCSSFLLLMLLVVPFTHESQTNSTMIPFVQTGIKLPKPRLKSETSIEEALYQRRSVREYRKEPLALATVGQLLWAAQGVTSNEGGRTAPSAGALYPLEVYLVSGAIEGIPAGVYHYQPAGHRLERVATGDKRKLLGAAAGRQSAGSHAAAVLVITAVYERTRVKYGDRAARYVAMEAGHAAQNVYLQAVALNTATVVIGAFSDGLVKRVLSLPENEEPLYLMPLGK